MRRALLVMTLSASCAILAAAQSERLDYATLGSIRDEGLNRSQVMDHISWLSDVYGPRLTGSPGIQQASLPQDEQFDLPLRLVRQDHAASLVMQSTQALNWTRIGISLAAPEMLPSAS